MRPQVSECARKEHEKVAITTDESRPSRTSEIENDHQEAEERGINSATKERVRRVMVET